MLKMLENAEFQSDLEEFLAQEIYIIGYYWQYKLNFCWLLEQQKKRRKKLKWNFWEKKMKKHNDIMEKGVKKLLIQKFFLNKIN